MYIGIKYFIPGIIAFFPAVSFCQLQVSHTLPQQLVDNVLLGPGVVAFNVNYTGSPGAIGFFNGVYSNIGLDSGIIMSSGKIIHAIGPNDSTSTSGINSTSGDSALTAIAGQPTTDAAILEFDFIPSSDSVRFHYVFASEEYFEGVCTPYNDVFAFLISGPGIPGVQNIALIPNTSTAVSISSVNGGVIGLPVYSPDTSYPYCFLSNTTYYIDNTTPPGMTVQYDGFTKVFTAKSAVVPCSTYHIRMAIADGGNDNTWDSGVFLEAGSFNSHYISVSSAPLLSGAYIDSSSVEGCGSTIINFKRYDSIPYPRTLNYTLSGTAISGIDYNINSPNIYFPPGQDNINLVVTPLYDIISEGIETVKLTIVPDFIVCSGWDTVYASTSIIDQTPISVNVFFPPQDCPYDSIAGFASAQGGYGNYYNYAWNWGSQSFTGDSVTFPTSINQVLLTVTDTCRNQSATTVITFDNCLPGVPTGFSPNGDNNNDMLYILGGDVNQLNFIIYNRWGQIVFETKDQTIGWDGTHNGKLVQSGVYAYILTVTGNKGIVTSTSGSITVIR